MFILLEKSLGPILKIRTKFSSVKDHMDTFYIHNYIIYSKISLFLFSRNLMKIDSDENGYILRRPTWMVFKDSLTTIVNKEMSQEIRQIISLIILKWVWSLRVFSFAQYPSGDSTKHSVQQDCKPPYIKSTLQLY